MKKLFLGFLMVIGFTFCLSIPANAQWGTLEGDPICRVYNPNSGEHLYTPSRFESRTLETLGWQYEGIAWMAPKPIVAEGNYNHHNKYASDHIFRFYNPNAGDHHYTMNLIEGRILLEQGWEDDRLTFPSAHADRYPIYRLYNPNAIAGAHHFTTNAAERDMLVGVGWKDEGIGFYAIALE
ncbi:hypothetical protein JZO70_21960 [Enterococcus sp. 669A]|uniref:DUF5648 domain-containing protein n=1 Tax=Candidatus Enterococcus moelleringii TaxID=2815325 RepID=A0ABS3LGU2_9ENTE|nr:hypothetical protein [Enterococcus sp. 669A]MBO1308852.1 hypothetical protein [Enterococcus sp. 669A]